MMLDIAAAIKPVLRAELKKEGQGVKQDYHQAKYWAGKACDNGHQNGCDLYRILNRGQ